MKTLSLFIIIVSILFLTISIFSQEPNRIHTVKPGDTLWDISAFYLNNPFLWPSIYQANKVKINNPHWIYPGQRFLIPPLVKKKEKVYITPSITKKGGEKKPEKEGGVKKVEAIEVALPIVAANLAFQGGYITKEKIGDGYIVETEPKKKENIVSSNTVYIDLGETDGIKEGDIFTIFRWGRNVKNPVNGRHLGKIVNILGKLLVTKVAENSSSAEIVQSFDIIKNHDKIMPYTPLKIPLKSKLVPSENPIEGHLVATKKEGAIIKPFQIVYIDLGESDGVSVGDYFEIVREGKVVSDPGTKRKVKLPELIAGGVQILRTTSETSTCYITEINGNLDVKVGELVRLIAKSPESTTEKGTEEEVEEEEM